MAALASIKASSGSVPCEHIGRGKRGMPSVGRMISTRCTGQVSGSAALWLGSQRAKEPAAPPAPAHHHPEQRPQVVAHRTGHIHTCKAGDRGDVRMDDPTSCTGTCMPSQVASQWGCRPPLCVKLGQPSHLPPRSPPTLHPSTHPPAPRTACCPSAAARRRSRHPPSAQPRSGQPGCRAGATRMVRVVRRPPVTATQQLHQTCAAS